MASNPSTPPEAATSGLARRVLRGAAFLGVGQYGVLAIGLIKTPILARLVAPEIHGVIVLALSWVSFLHLFRLELREVVISDPEGDPARLTTQYVIEVLSSLVGVLLGGLVYLAAPRLADLAVGLLGAASADAVSNLTNPLVWQAIFVLLGLRVFFAATSTPLYILQRDIRQDVITRLTLLGALLGLGVAVALAWLGYPLASLLADAALPVIVLGLGAWLVAGWRPALIWDASVARDVAAFAATMWTGGLFGKISFEFDDWLVGMLRGNRAVGFYGKAYTLSKMPMDVFAGVIAGIALSAYAQSEATGRAVLARAYRLMTWLLIRVVAWSSVIILAAADEIVLILLGPDWPGVPLLVRLMFVYVLGRPLFQNNAQLLIAIRQEKLYRSAQMVQAIVLLLLAPGAVYFLGAEGASLAVNVMMLAGFALSQVYVNRFLDVRLGRVYLLPVVLTLVLSPVVYALGGAIGGGVLVSLLLKGAVATVLFGAAVLLVERDGLREVYALVAEHLLSPADDGGEERGETVASGH